MSNTSLSGGSLGANPLGGHKSAIPASQNVAINRRSNESHHIPVMTRIIAKARAYFIFRGIKSSLKEVEMIEKGIKKPKSLDQLLNEL